VVGFTTALAFGATSGTSTSSESSSDSGYGFPLATGLATTLAA
jgi:hypothetical protein